MIRRGLLDHSGRQTWRTRKVTRITGCGGRRYVQAPAAAGVNERRGVRAANVGGVSNPERVKGGALSRARPAPRRAL
jgi:hypothetical protein